MLPSQGLFYNDDFEIFIKRANSNVIREYELNYSKEDLGMIIGKVKRVVESNVILSVGYSFDDIKSIDVIFLFFIISSISEAVILCNSINFTYFFYFLISYYFRNNYKIIITFWSIS